MLWKRTAKEARIFAFSGLGLPTEITQEGYDATSTSTKLF